MMIIKKSWMMVISLNFLWSFAVAQTITIGVEKLDYYPHYTNKTGTYTGWAREVFDHFGKTEGYQIIYKILPIQRLYENFIDQTLDFKYPDSPFWRQELKKNLTVTYSNPVISYIDGVMVIPERAGQGLSLLKKLGTVRGFTPFDYLDLIEAKSVQIKESNNFIGLLEKTILKRIDGAYINIDVANYHLQVSLKQPQALVYDKDLPHTKGTYFLSTIKHPEILKKFDVFLKQEAAIITQLKTKYGLSMD